MLSFPSLSNEKKEIIINNFTSIIQELMNRTGIATIDAILLAFPGPFDSPNGIALLKGVSKYETLYNVNLKDILFSHFKTPILFLNDIEAFSLGLLNEKKELNIGRTLFITMGTGLGSTFSSDGVIIKNGGNIPPNGWIYNLRYKDSIVDDYISLRGLKRITGENISGLELFNRAKKGDKKALQSFYLFGKEIAMALSATITSFMPNSIVIGGNIARAHNYFEKSLFDNLDKTIKVYFIDNTSLYAAKGLICEYRRKNNE